MIRMRIGRRSGYSDAMIRRALLLTAAVAALSVASAAPALGQAYGGEAAIDCVRGVVVGEHFPPGSSPAVSVDGRVVGNADVREDGTFAFPLPASIGPGPHEIAVEGVAATVTCTTRGEVAGTVIAPGAGAAAGSGGGGLAFTGTTVAALTVLGGALLGAGVATLAAARRRRRAAVGVGDDVRDA
jgi:hypothetical protein